MDSFCEGLVVDLAGCHPTTPKPFGPPTYARGIRRRLSSTRAQTNREKKKIGIRIPNGAGQAGQELVKNKREAGANST